MMNALEWNGIGRLPPFVRDPRIEPRPSKSLDSGISGNKGTVPDRGTTAPRDSASRSPCRGVPGHLG